VHPVLVLVPAVALIVGPRLWVGQVLKRHNQRNLVSAPSAGELARELLDKKGLQAVRVESTDMGDHYDPIAKSVRLSRDKIDRRTLTALTTAAHEVAHAVQHAARYGPFVWRTRLVKIAQRAGEGGAVLFLAVPFSAILSRNHPIPPILIGLAAAAMLGTGLIAQLAALPSELDASFGRALAMLREGYVSEKQEKEVRKILWACSLTYVASSLVAVLHMWPWLGRPSVALLATTGLPNRCPRGPGPSLVQQVSIGALLPRFRVQKQSNRKSNSLLESLLRPIGKPLIRLWLRVAEPL
jgi:Zn-dependent membrane protease YugP